MADSVVMGTRRSQVVHFATFVGDDGTLAALEVADVIASHKAEYAWWIAVNELTAENTAGTGIDSFADPTGVDGDAPALNPETPPA